LPEVVDFAPQSLIDQGMTLRRMPAVLDKGPEDPETVPAEQDPFRD
jgi:hypothetical protein